jgi:hypothetical protein
MTPANLLADVMAWYAAAPSASTSAHAAAPAADVLGVKRIVQPATARPDQVLYLGP